MTDIPYMLRRPGVAHRVIVTIVVAKTLRGDRYLYRGQRLPADVLPHHIDHMLEHGLVEQIGGAP